MKQYIDEKVKMLEKDFKIKLSYDEVAKINTASSVYHLDRIARDILLKHL